MEFIIRPARADDLHALVQIGNDGHLTLFEAGAVPDASSGDDSDAYRELGLWLTKGLLFVAADADDRPLAYGSAQPLDGDLHICELDVAREWQRRGLGRRLMLALIAEAKNRRFTGATLTTDRFVRFNAAFYETLGFRILDSSALSEHLQAILDDETARGLDPARRCAMRLAF